VVFYEPLLGAGRRENNWLGVDQIRHRMNKKRAWIAIAKVIQSIKLVPIDGLIYIVILF
jgi:hypothetical protein